MTEYETAALATIAWVAKFVLQLATFLSGANRIAGNVNYE